MKMEIRADHAIVEGYVTATGRDSRVLPSPNGPFIEQVVPGTFKRALKNAENVELRFNHQRSLGSVKDGNLELKEDNIGLYARATITDEEVIKKGRNGELRGWSFGFYSRKDRREPAGEGLSRRYLEEVDLREVSILDRKPAYIATSIEQRGEEDIMIESRVEDDETEIREEIPENNKELEQRGQQPDFSLFEKEIEMIALGG